MLNCLHAIYLVKNLVPPISEMIIGKNLEYKVIFRLQIYYTYYRQVKLKIAFYVFIRWIVIDTP